MKMFATVVRFAIFGAIGMLGAFGCFMLWVATQPKMEPMSRTTGIAVVIGVALVGLLGGMAMAVERPKG